MKADKYGTRSEQLRYLAGWKRASDVPRGEVSRCKTCRYIISPDDHRGLLCGSIGFATSAMAWCRGYEMVRVNAD